MSSNGEIEPLSGATSIFTYEPGVDGALRYDTGCREVYLAFGFEGATGAAARDTLMRRAVEWLEEAPEVSLQIYDVSGRLVRRLRRASGDGPLSWDGRDSRGAEVAGGDERVRIAVGAFDRRRARR